MTVEVDDCGKLVTIHRHDKHDRNRRIIGSLSFPAEEVGNLVRAVAAAVESYSAPDNKAGDS